MMLQGSDWKPWHDNRVWLWLAWVVDLVGVGRRTRNGNGMLLGVIRIHHRLIAETKEHCIGCIQKHDLKQYLLLCSGFVV